MDYIKRDMEMNFGKLYYLTVPIGNLDDITINVLNALKKGLYFYVEDTRSFKKLLNLYGISIEGKNIKSYHDQSRVSVADEINQLLLEGVSIYYCSEAGSPVISDPGVGLIKSIESLNKDVQVISYGGVCSLISALEVSKVTFSKFMFHGFFPRDNKGRTSILKQVNGISKTHLFFESPHRVHKAISFIFESGLPPDELYICRELTKKFQEVIKVTSIDYIDKIGEVKAKGEFVIILNYFDSKSATEHISEDVVILAKEILEGNSKPRAIAKLIAKIVKQPVKDVYLTLEKNLKNLDN